MIRERVRRHFSNVESADGLERFARRVGIAGVRIDECGDVARRVQVHCLADKDKKRTRLS
jgi:hypothetical protein